MEHSFDIEFAQEHGLAAAILYRHMQFWITKNKANTVNLRDGRTWTYNSVKAFKEQFPYLGPGQIRAALELLVDRKILLRSNYNKKKGDRTTWYAFADEKTALKGLPPHLLKSQRVEESPKSEQPQTPFAKNAKPSPKQRSLCENSRPLPDQSNPDTPTQINNPIEKTPQEVLELDCRIVQESKFLAGQLEQTFRPGERSRKTFGNIIRYFVNSCQQDPRKICWFKEAVEWARIARIDGRVAGGKALFVATVKDKTGYRANPRLMSDKAQEDARARASPAA